MNTDIEWEKWGQRDPYFAVLTDPRFRASAMNDDAKTEFFDNGLTHVDYVLRICRNHIQADFTPTRILDFGCGVGRLLIPFAQTGAEVVGVDISPSMLREARRNCDAAGATAVELVLSDDALTRVDGEFDLVHTFIVMQHIEIDRGLRIFQELVRRVRRGGIGAIHIHFAKGVYQANLGVQPPPPTPPPESWWRQVRQTLGLRQRPPSVEVQRDRSDPEMQMNPYNLSQLMFVLKQSGIERVHSELTDHGGEIGAFLFFLCPA